MTTEEQREQAEQLRAEQYDQPTTSPGFGSEGQRLDYIDSLEHDYAHGRSATPATGRDEIATAIVQSGGTDPRKQARR